MIFEIGIKKLKTNNDTVQWNRNEDQQRFSEFLHTDANLMKKDDFRIYFWKQKQFLKQPFLSSELDCCLTFVTMMFFKANEFELTFAPLILKRGLKLFERGKVQLLARLPNGEYRFEIDGDFRLKIIKRGEKILSYTCVCDSPSFCAHLCATLFYFQKDALGIMVKQKLKDENKRKRILVANGNSLFIQDGVFNTNTLAPNEKKAFSFHGNRLCAVLKTYLNTDQLDQLQLNALYETISRMSQEIVFTSQEYSAAFYFNLALITEIPKIFNQRLTTDESQILSVIEKATLDLNQDYELGLSHLQADVWFRACLLAGTLKNQVGFKVFFFMVPRALQLIYSKSQLQTLKLLLNKRRIHFKASEYFDGLEILKLELTIKEAKIYEKILPSKIDQQVPEFVIAQTELLFCAKKTNQAFEALEAYFFQLKNERSGFQLPFLKHLVLKAKEKQNKNFEFKYLEELMILGLYIAPDQALRFLELCPEGLQETNLEHLVKEIKARPNGQTLDKLFVLLMEAKSYDTLILELKKYKNKFFLLHQVALKRLPDFDNSLLKLYTKHLCEALTDGAYTDFYQMIFDNALIYLKQLPENEAQVIVGEVQKKLGAMSYINRHIQRVFKVL